jgi:hypothetical protein
MNVVNIDDLKPGMVLAEPVCNHQDQVLLEAGRKVTAKAIRVFKSWGIRRVAVKSGAAGEKGGQDAARPALAGALDERLRARFADVLTDPLMAEIMQAAGRHLAARQVRKKAANGRR